jgi:hypothetical protein
MFRCSRLVVSGFVALGASLALLAAPAAAQETAAANCGPPRTTTGTTGAGDGRFAQPFSPSISGSLTRVQVDVTKAGTAGNYVVSINAVDGAGVPTNTVLASTTVADSFPDGARIIDAVFATPAEVVAGQSYAVVVSRPGSNSLTVGLRIDCPRNLFFAGPDPAAFGPAGGFDLVFVAFVTPPSPPEPEPGPKADGTLTIDANKGKVEKGRKVTLTGQLDVAANEGCEPGRAIQIQRRLKSEDDSKFETFKTVTTDDAGNFTLRQKVKKTFFYRAVVGETEACDDELSNTQKVRVQKKKAAQEA